MKGKILRVPLEYCQAPQPAFLQCVAVNATLKQEMNNGFVSRRRKTHSLMLSQKRTQRCCPRLMRLLSTCLRGDKELNTSNYGFSEYICFIPQFPQVVINRPAPFWHRCLQPEALKTWGCPHVPFPPGQALWCPIIRRPTQSATLKKTCLETEF